MLETECYLIYFRLGFGINSIEKKVARLGATLGDRPGYPIPLGNKGKATFFSTEPDSKFTMEPKSNLNRLLICSIEKKVVRLGTTLWDKHGYPIPLGSKGKATFFFNRFKI